jgi:nicotinate-nucleotide pyrophosphorylase (carboxylating)
LDGTLSRSVFSGEVAVKKEFPQISWNEALRDDSQELLQRALREDLGTVGDVTTAAVVPPDVFGAAAVVVRHSGVIAGMPCAELALQLVDSRLHWLPEIEDGQPVAPGQTIARIQGPAASLLAAERLILNLLGRLSGIATLTHRYVEAIGGSRAKIYDTRKTTPGWRRLEKYAVRCGGGWNHRAGLFAAVLIKDNHLAIGCPPGTSGAGRYSIAEAVLRARRYVAQQGPAAADMIVEAEVDTLEQLQEILPASPDLVLLDNMGPERLRQAVALRDTAYPHVELEASGGINLQCVREIAESGVDRISVGALTHSAVGLDIGLDWILG